MRAGIVITLLFMILCGSVIAAAAAAYVPGNETLKEARADQRDEEDLAAQQGMNEAAQGMLTLARWQTALAAASTLALGLTLYFSYHSNLASHAAAAAAREQVEHQKLLAVASIVLRGAQAYKYAQELWSTLEVRAQNLGQTAAKEVRLEAAISIFIGESEIRSARLICPNPAMDVAAETDFSIVMRSEDFKLTEEELIAITDNRLTVKVPYKMQFRDLYGDRRVEEGTFAGKMRIDIGGWDFFGDLHREDELT